MEMKFSWNNNRHMSKMAAIKVYGKILLKIVYPRNQRNDYKDTCYVASGTPSHQSLFKLWPWGWPWPIFWQGQILKLELLYRKMLHWWILWKFCSLQSWSWLIYTKWVNIGLWGSLVLCQTSYRYPRSRYQVSVYRTNDPLVL